MGSKQVFILDDSVLILEMAKEALSAQGYVVHAASNLTEFEQHAAEHRADLVLLDINMPEVFGDDVATVLKEVRAWTVPIVFFSSVEPVQLAQRAQEAGAHGWVSKREGVAALVERVDRILKGEPS
jgi:DNA-binding NarL/FixJ family response regulator